ncbi:MAG: DUF5668 domain-containing protein [Bryobacteraceae bacterium]
MRDDLTEDFQTARRRNRSASSRLFFAIFLIGAGTLLFLGNLGLIPVRDIWDYWPLALIAAGLGRLTSNRYVAVLLIAFGTVALLITLGILHLNPHDDSWPISLLLIAFGAAGLMKVLAPEQTARRSLGFPSRPIQSSSDSLLKDTAIFGEVKRKIDTADFQGGVVSSVFGSVELNLRRAQISSPDRTATLEANAVFGAIKIRVPEGWRIDIAGAAVLGNFVDKTIPPIAAGSDTPTLIITGYAVFGAVEIVD